MYTHIDISLFMGKKERIFLLLFPQPMNHNTIYAINYA